jgi:hypothetical protein
LQIADCRLQNEAATSRAASSVSSNLQSAICNLQSTWARAAREGYSMLFFGRKKRLTDYASCAG